MIYNSHFFYFFGGMMIGQNLYLGHLQNGLV